MEEAFKDVPVIAGTMTWGVWGRNLDTSGMEGLMHHCLEAGIHTFDHADIYGGYTTEAAFGKAFASSGIRREDIRLISKCGIQYVCDARPVGIKHYQYDADYIVWSAERSLSGLQTEYLDLLLLHRPSPLMEPREVAAAFDKLKTSGKVRRFGVSNFTPSQIRLIETAVPVEAHQFECSLSARGPLTDGTLDDCLIGGREAMAWSPLGNFFREQGPEQERLAACMQSLKPKYGADESQLLLAWLMGHPAGIRPVVGTTRPERLTDAVAAADIRLEREDWFALLVAAQGHKVP
ncbi:aldo/keto reductase family oxidoreductase [Robiginitalea sp. SC105]|uniref:aldo/keto reductase n=1 Tax=Robiginitalea sp. SC105 TaxID=2762332 RepID=UPI00163AA0F9|nr:aldo/keto reductase [Robiginitalea sp. SC105]MBC2838043.1 aldo/keto reductase [Robiginitalea sp. SC105]